MGDLLAGVGRRPDFEALEMNMRRFSGALRAELRSLRRSPNGTLAGRPLTCPGPFQGRPSGGSARRPGMPCAAAPRWPSAPRRHPPLLLHGLDRASERVPAERLVRGLSGERRQGPERAESGPAVERSHGGLRQPRPPAGRPQGRTGSVRPADPRKHRRAVRLGRAGTLPKISATG